MISILEEQMKSIDKEVQELFEKKRDIRNEYIKEVQDKLRPLIGVCFEWSDAYYKILDVPIPREVFRDTFRIDFNPNAIRCLKVNTANLNTKPKGESAREIYYYITYEEAFTNACASVDPLEYFKNEHTIITAEEFNEKLEQAFDIIRNMT